MKDNEILYFILLEEFKKYISYYIKVKKFDENDNFQY